MALGAYIKPGAPIGLYDSAGREFTVGCTVRLDCSINNELHGNWAEYEVGLRGVVPVLLYLRSERGAVLPKHFTGTCLSDIYDQKTFLTSDNLMSLAPDEEALIIDAE